jgi:hypothetical protein
VCRRRRERSRRKAERRSRKRSRNYLSGRAVEIMIEKKQTGEMTVTITGTMIA